MPRHDIVAGLILLALAGAYGAASTGIADSSLSDAVGARGLPVLLAGGLAVLALLLVGKGLLALRAGAPQPEAAGDTERPAGPLRAAGLVAIGVGYMAVAPLLGYAPAIALLVGAVALYEGARPTPLLLAVAAGAGAGFWLVFVRLLGTTQPAFPWAG
jgi:cell division protein FtsW (lipid II flippase)